jgi:hypothetical protein
VSAGGRLRAKETDETWRQRCQAVLLLEAGSQSEELVLLSKSSYNGTTAGMEGQGTEGPSRGVLPGLRAVGGGGEGAWIGLQ